MSRGAQGFAGELDMDAQLADMEAERRRPMNVKQLGDRSGGRGGPNTPSKKRQARDAKFGEWAEVGGPARVGCKGGCSRRGFGMAMGKGFPGVREEAAGLEPSGEVSLPYRYYRTSYPSHSSSLRNRTTQASAAASR